MIYNICLSNSYSIQLKANYGTLFSIQAKLKLKPTTENIPNDINCRGKFYEYIHY